MKRVPKEYVEKFKELLYIDKQKNISDSSASNTWTWIKYEVPSIYKKTLAAGLMYEIRKYQKHQKLVAKQKKLIGEE